MNITKSAVLKEINAMIDRLTELRAEITKPDPETQICFTDNNGEVWLSEGTSAQLLDEMEYVFGYEMDYEEASEALSRFDVRVGFDSEVEHYSTGFLGPNIPVVVSKTYTLYLHSKVGGKIFAEFKLRYDPDGDIFTIVADADE